MENQTEEEEISTEEVLASIRNILLEKKEAEALEPAFELTKEMLYKPVVEPNFNASADQMMDEFASFFETKR